MDDDNKITIKNKLIDKDNEQSNQSNENFNEKNIENDTNRCLFDISGLNNIEPLNESVISNLNIKNFKIEQHSIALANSYKINGCKMECSCSNKNDYLVYNSFKVFDKLDQKSFYDYGIDFTNSFAFIEQYLFFVALYFIFMFTIFFIGLIKRNFEFPIINNDGFNILYFELYFQIIIKEESELQLSKPSLMLILNLVYLLTKMVVSTVLNIRLKKRLKKTREDYITHISSKYIDESVFSVFGILIHVRLP